MSPFAVYLDQSGDAAYLLGADGMPTTLLIDREGRELGRVIGAAEWDGAEMMSPIRGYLGTRS